MNEQIIVFLLIAAAVFSVYMGVLVWSRRNTMRQRVQRVAVADIIDDAYGVKRSPLALGIEQALSMIGVNISEARRTHSIALTRAGIFSSDAVAYLLFVQRFIQPIFVLIGILVLTKLVLGFGHMSSSTKAVHFLLAILLFAFGFIGTKLYLDNRTNRRRKILQMGFPDALDLMLVCIESGLALDAAMTRVARELAIAHPEMAREIDRTRIELTVLNDRTQALNNMADRTNTPGFRALTSSLIQSEKFGTSLSETLRVLSDDYRVTRLLNAENKAARIPAVITIPLIFFILPAFMLLIMGPPIVKLNEKGGPEGMMNGR